jgi:two-component system chemotaxis response regulator CheB
MTESPLRVLVIDDSYSNRQLLQSLLRRVNDLEVIGTAQDGEEGLRKALSLNPDVITLDLEMPRLGGYAFLRLLMANRPTPVVVVSSFSARDNVFKALELGALDFIAKPAGSSTEEVDLFARELHEKLRAVRLVHRPPQDPVPGIAPRVVDDAVPFVIVIGASTGGPPAIQRVLEAVALSPAVCLVICQHMPPSFTRAFADRLDRVSAMTVKEAADGDVLERGHAYVAPGGKHLTLSRKGKRIELFTATVSPADKHAPSVDRLFESAARALGPDALGLVLTGMGGDGSAGARAIKGAGGTVWAESEDSAVIFGMPREAIDAGAVSRVLTLAEIGPALVAEAKRRRDRT